MDPFILQLSCVVSCQTQKMAQWSSQEERPTQLQLTPAVKASLCSVQVRGSVKTLDCGQELNPSALVCSRFKKYRVMGINIHISHAIIIIVHFIACFITPYSSPAKLWWSWNAYQWQEAGEWLYCRSHCLFQVQRWLWPGWLKVQRMPVQWSLEWWTAHLPTL